MSIEDSQSSTGPDTAADGSPRAVGTVETIAVNGSPSDQNSLLERLAAELAGLRRDFDAKIRYDEVKERQIANMHEELQTLRAGAHLRILRSIFTDLIAMHDDITDALSANEAGSMAQPATILGSLRETLLEALLRNGVSSYSVDSDELDRARQRVIDVIPTPDHTLDGLVVRRPRPGFEFDGRVLRPEWVVVHRHTETEEPA
jgi:molecular chaperone GrpE